VLLAGCGAEGCTEAVMLMNGFTLAGLVRIGFIRQDHRARGQQPVNVRSQKVQAHRSGPAGARRSPMTAAQGGKTNGHHHHHRLADLDRRARRAAARAQAARAGRLVSARLHRERLILHAEPSAADAIGTCPWGWIASGSYCLRNGRARP